MEYEQKYKEALERAIVAHKDEDKHLKATLERIFPELVESEDEKIRKRIIHALHGDVLDIEETNKAIAWLEKQGEQKSSDKVEPKFHEGEWLCENEPNNYARYIQILETVNVQGKERYRISRDIHNDDDIVAFDFVEKYYHKFDIKDAKNGDLLVSLFNRPFIYNGHFDTFKVSAYCGLNCTGEDFLIANELCNWTNNDNIKPATKEQRDLLFQKMKEAGYEWKAETKELIKVTKSKESTGELIDEEKSWSEEDEKICNDIIRDITIDKSMCKYEVSIAICDEQIEWLKQLKYRIK